MSKKLTAHFFSHDYNARGDEKIIKLLSKMGWEGYGLYWAVIEKLFENGGELEEDYDCIAYDLRTKPERITDIIKGYDLFYTSQEKIRSYSVDYRIALRMKKSLSARESVMNRYEKPTNEERTKPNRTTINKIKENKIKQNNINKDTTEFETFWKEYPKKTGKDKALESWNKKKPNLQECLKTLSWQKVSEGWTKEGGKYIPMPTTWLNQGRWQDEQPIVHTSGADPIKGKYAGRSRCILPKEND